MLKRIAGCKEQLIIDAVVVGDARQKKRPLYNPYVVYQKTYDSVSHSWLLVVLELHKIEQHIVELLRLAMKSVKLR